MLKANGKIVLAFYRSALRHAKVLDSTREFKAILPAKLSLDMMICLGGKNCDFYKANVSCVKAVQDGFRLHINCSNRESQMHLDRLITVNKELSDKIALLHVGTAGEKKLLRVTEPPSCLTREEKYKAERAKNKKLDAALSLVESAQALLSSNASQGDTKPLIEKADLYYSESLKIYPTADAHAYLAWHQYLDGNLNEAMRSCQHAIELDPCFGNPYNDMGLIHVQLGNCDTAISYFNKAKVATRYDVRHFPCLNLGALYLEQNLVVNAFHEYIQALKWMGPDEGITIRNTIADMALVLSQKSNSIIN